MPSSKERKLIAYLEGKLVEKTPTELVLDVGGIGYHLQIPLSTYERLGKNGSRIKILTYQYVREDAFKLFGFVTLEEKNLFELLLSVSGIGPKIALGILSCISVDDFNRFITLEDLDSLTGISGIGKKTAKRLIVELKDKIDQDFKIEKGTIFKDKVKLDLAGQAINALISLGFTKYQAKEAVKSAIERAQKKLGLEELIKQSLKFSK